MKEIVVVKNLKLTYHSKDGETEAIKDISFSIKEGEFVAIVGPSGCGKNYYFVHTFWFTKSK